MDSLVPLLSGGGTMDNWKPKRQKSYPHFDSLMATDKIIEYVSDPANIAGHKFYPFLTYDQHWTKYAPKGERGDSKTRTIRYASRLDSNVFSYYRHKLSAAYEAQLLVDGLEDSVLAYRRILRPDGRGKSNIDFAKEAFERIRSTGDCFILAVDIKGFFDNLDHVRLKGIWSSLLGSSSLPADDYAVYKAITRFADVEKIEVYRRLGHFGEKRINKAGKSIDGYLTPYKELRAKLKLCRGAEFREKIAGTGQLPSIIRVNKKGWGIPQGAPLSDLLANAYLLDFDRVMKKIASDISGTYYRYSDDILLILPTDISVARDMFNVIRANLKAAGERLNLSEKKSMLFGFTVSGSSGTIKQVPLTEFADPQADLTKQLEYLGFRFDGQRIFVRDSTLSNLRRKMASAARKSSFAHVKRYPGKTYEELLELYNFEGFMRRFGRVRDFDSSTMEFRDWTFWTYIRRAQSVLGQDSATVQRQFRNFSRNARTMLERQMKWASERRQKRS